MIDRRDFLRLGIGAGGMACGGMLPALLSGQEPSLLSGQEVASGRGIVAHGTSGAVATVNEYATNAALRILRAGGNAADAAIAAGVMLSVVDGFNSGIGGGCFILARNAEGKVLAIDGREMAPQAAHEKMFFVNGVPQTELSQTGALASGVPGSIAAYDLLSKQMGTGKWQASFQQAADVAEEGFTISQQYAARLRSVASEMIRFDAAREIFFDQQESPRKSGDRLVQRDLAQLLRQIAVDGSEAFYRGDFAAKTDRWMRDNGGIVTAEDLTGYRVVEREAVTTDFRGHLVIGFPPPSSGGVHVAQILSLLERFDLSDLYQSNRVAYYHVVAEAMRLAFADRAKFLGDPDFTAVPRGLLDSDYLQRRSQLIRIDQRMGTVLEGDPPANSGNFSDKPRHTTHFTVVDQQGNWVAVTATVNTTFGSKVVIPGTGVVMNNQMDDFAIAPGVPNAFGLVGQAANAPAGGKRPLSSMSPTIAVGPEGPVVTCGAAGGPRIISATTQILLNHLALGMDLETAMRAVRVHHQWRPDQLVVEESMDPAIRKGLEGLGHELKTTSAVATAQAIGRGADGQLTAVGEPRLPGVAAAY